MRIKSLTKQDQGYTLMIQRPTTAVQIKKGNCTMKHLKFSLPLLLSLCVGFTTNMANAQSVGDNAASSLTREQVKKDRGEFLRTHHYDTVSENWVLKPDFEPPTSMKTRAEVRAERAEFIKTHKYDTVSDTWVPLKGEPKSELTREQVRAETAQFIRTHEWDEEAGGWVEKKVVSKKKK